MTMSADQTIALAMKHLRNAKDASSMQTSARLCLGDAVALSNEGKLIEAKQRALHSLKYSVGVLHEDYKRAARVTVEHMADF